MNKERKFQIIGFGSAFVSLMEQGGLFLLLLLLLKGLAPPPPPPPER